MYLPLYNDNEKKVFKVSFRRFAVVTVFLPLIAFVACVVLSVYKDFESSTFTHCKVFNALPSVSAAIGSFYPQNLLWRLAIGVHALPRYLTATMYFTYYRSVLKSHVHSFATIACVMNLIEVSSLIGLSFWNSSDYYPIHKTCFVTFVGASEVYMLMSCVLLQKYKRTFSSELERASLRTKWYCFFINVFSFVAAGYFFLRHNNHCEPMVYTWFAASEYIVILTNMGFHMTACHDFIGKWYFSVI